MINPYRNRESSTRNISMAERVMRWTATITTSLGAFIWARSLALQYLPEGWAWNDLAASAAALCAAALMAWLTDLMFGDLLQRVAYDLLASRHPNVLKWQGPNYFKSLRNAESIGFGLLLVALLAFDGYTTIIIRDPIADQARQAEIQDIASVTASVSSSHSAATAPMQQQIAALKKEIKEYEKRVGDQNGALQRLANDGNGWAAQELSRKKKAATKAQKSQLETLEGTYTSALNSSAASLAETERITNQRNQAALESNQRNRSVMAGMYTAFTVAPKLLAIVLRILMVVSFLAYSHNFDPDLTGDGIIDYQDVEEYYERQKAARQQRSSTHAHTAPPHEAPHTEPAYEDFP